MSSIFRRTSITVNEAVYILLGQINGPVEFTPVDEAGWAEIESISFCLSETLDDELAVFTSEHAEAVYDKQPKDVIAEKLAAVERHKVAIEQANAYLCAINDELNKKEQAALKVDVALSSPACIFITLHSFNGWAKKLGKSVLVDLPSLEQAPIAPPSADSKNAPNKRVRMLDQEQAILDEVLRQGFDPMALPPLTPGKSGIKAAVRAALNRSTLFGGPTVFDRAWERLRKDKRIAQN